MKKWLYVTVFLTGMASLVIEVAGVRMLSPYFGNTMFTVSSVISVILAALSLGYYLGGELSERNCNIKMFYGIIWGSGIGVLVCTMAGRMFLEYFAFKMPMTYGPLVAAIVTFFLPSLFIGFISPYAVKLGQTLSIHTGVGKISGQMYFWSTMGSIAGSLLTGFVFIPTWGVSNIMTGTGIFLVGLGAIPGGLILVKSKKKFNFWITGLSIAVIVFSLTVEPVKNKVVYSQDGWYEKLSVIDFYKNGRKARAFIQDRSNSGSMYLDSDELTADYTKYFELYKSVRPSVEKTMVLGGGIYSIPKAIVNLNPNATVIVAEIEPKLPDVAKKYFNYKESSQIITKIEDGRRVLSESKDKYDLIFGDAYYSLYSIPSHLVTREFYQLVENRLEENGVFLVNILGSLSRSQPSLISAQIKTFKEVFKNSYFLAIDSPAYTGTQGFIFMGIRGDKKPDWKIVEKLVEGKIFYPAGLALEKEPIFTDDFSPADYYSSKLFLLKNYDDLAEEAYGSVADLMTFGPRYISAPGHRRTQEYIKARTASYTKEVIEQGWEKTTTDGKNYQLKNIIARFFPDREKRIILATHYDSKRYAVYDKQNKQSAMPGANDSGSGTAMLLEISRMLANYPDLTKKGVDVVFFDGEEGEENIQAEWRPMGSEYFAANLDKLYPDKKPDSGIVFDMICDKNLQLKPEVSSMTYNKQLVDDFWKTGRKYYPGVFSLNTQPLIRDDHTSLSNAGVPSILVIDFDYPYFHTTKDTIDKCSKVSMEVVLRTTLEYLNSI